MQGFICRYAKGIKIHLIHPKNFVFDMKIIIYLVFSQCGLKFIFHKNKVTFAHVLNAILYVKSQISLQIVQFPRNFITRLAFFSHHGFS